MKKRRIRKMPKTRTAPQSSSKSHLTIVYRDPADLKLWEENPRRNDAAAKRLAKIIERHGFTEPVTMRKEDGIIYKGNCRLKAARLLGLAEIPVMVVSYPRKQDAVDEAIADNVASEWSMHDEDLLNDHLGERDVVEFAAATGLEPMQIEGLRNAEGKFADYSADTFADVVEKFESSDNLSPSDKRECWIWFQVPGTVELDALIEKFSRTGKSRELDYGAVLAALGLKKPSVCEVCSGSGNTGKTTTGNKRCESCRGSGYKPTASVLPRQMRKTRGGNA